MKKFLSLFLAIVMVFAIAINVFATDGENYEVFSVAEDETETSKGKYATLEEALAAAADGDIIRLLEDTTEEFDAKDRKNLYFTIDKAITIDGDGKSLEFVSAAANQFAINVNVPGKEVTIKNFEKITATVGGGIAVSAGTLNIDGVAELSSKGRAALKTQNGTDGVVKAINVTNSTITLLPDAATSEATMILSGNQASTLTLNDGAIVQKDIASNNAPSTQSAVIYFANSGNHSIVMNERSIIWAGHADGTSASCIGLGDSSVTGTNSVTINEGAYLYAGSNVTNFYFFGENTANKNTITAWDGAFVDGTEATLKGFLLRDAEGKYYDCTFEAVEGSEEEYKMVRNERTDADYQIGTENFVGSFSAALAAAKDGDTIKLLKDISTTEKELSLSGKSVTIDLNDFTFDFNLVDKKYFMSSLKSTLTIKNGTFKATCGFIVQDGGHLIFDDVNAISGQYAGTSRALVKLNAGNCRLTVKNSTLECKTTIGEPFILSEKTSNGTINLLENAVLKYSGNLGGNDQNHPVIANQGSATLTVNVSSTAKLIAAQQHNEKTKTASVLCKDSDGNVTLNLEKGATLVADRIPGSSSTKFIHDKAPTSGSITINDKGANYVISPDVAKQGIILPENVFGYTLNGTAVTLGDDNDYLSASATENVTLTAVSFDFAPEMITGAAIFLDKPIGMRFGATLDVETYNELKALGYDVEFGFAIAKKGSVGAKFDVENMDKNLYTLVAADGAVTGDVFTFEADILAGADSIISADKTGFKQNISAKAYVKVTINGEAKYYWAEFSVLNNSRSMYSVAQSYVADTVNGSTTNVVANYIIAVAEEK